jgi:hypothetical protein
VVANVTRLLVEALEELLTTETAKPNSPRLSSLLDCVVDSRVQLWGAAVPMNVWKWDDGEGGFIYDSQFQVGVCGDWLLEPSIAGAWTSGRRLARHLEEVRQQQQDPKSSGGGNNTNSAHDHNRYSSVGFVGHFEVSPGVRKLGIASLDGVMDKAGRIESNNVHPPKPKEPLVQGRNQSKHATGTTTKDISNGVNHNLKKKERKRQLRRLMSSSN